MSARRPEEPSVRGAYVASVHVRTTTVITSVELDEDDEVEDEDEERANVETLAHPTRDDLHEQRERRQVCEGVLHASARK